MDEMPDDYHGPSEDWFERNPWFQELVNFKAFDLAKWLISGGELLTPSAFWRCKIWREFLKENQDEQLRAEVRQIVLCRLNESKELAVLKQALTHIEKAIKLFGELEQLATYPEGPDKYPILDGGELYFRSKIELEHIHEGWQEHIRNQD